MATVIHERIHALIEETNHAFISTDGAVNADYAEYAALAFSEFKAALNDPALTKDDLIRILRRGMLKSRIRCAGDEGDCWSRSMAYYLARKANENRPIAS